MYLTSHIPIPTQSHRYVATGVYLNRHIGMYYVATGMYYVATGMYYVPKTKNLEVFQNLSISPVNEDIFV